MPRTIFILGAGASFPYNFPLGLGLLDEIIVLTQIDTYSETLQSQEVRNIKKLLLDRFDKDEIKDFRNLLSESGLNSIDYFLTLNPEFIEIGKACISYIILKSERKWTNVPKNGGNWYRYLWNEIASVNPQKFDFKIYTFNYDRSLEFYLNKRVSAAFNKKEEKQKEFLDSIPITHLHGSLGYLNYGDLESIDSYHTLEKVGQNIKIISEVEIDDNFKLLQDDLNEAKHIIFLGFGFHPINMERIGVNEMIFNNDTYFYASTKGLRTEEVNAKFNNIIRSKYTSGLSDKFYNNHIRCSDSDCLELLREKFLFNNLYK